MEQRNRQSRKVRNESYGQKPGTLEKLLKEQNFKCAVCGVPLTWGTMHVDHKHK